MSVGYTPHGLQYPNADDPVRDGAQRIKELAGQIDTKLLYFNYWGWIGNLTTDAQGAAQLTVPGNIVGVTVMYMGGYGPIHIDAYTITNNVVGLFPYRPDGSKIPNSGIGATAVAAFQQ